jgi:uncharacterized YigZ family protein
MLEINQQYENQIIINKSRFIAILYPIKHKDDIVAALEDAKVKYPKATHYCYAATLGDQRAWATYQDNGEPKGTAGLPILDVIDHHDLTNTLCVVIRYFGGIKLGAGGLVRAYSNATSEVLKIAVFMEKHLVYGYKLTFSYALINQIDNKLNSIADIKDKQFLKDVTYHVNLYEPKLDALDDIKHLIKIEKTTDSFIYIPIKK